jgi:hypothetical protein
LTFHYNYVIHKESTREYYIGVRSSECDPQDDPYMGSSVILDKRLETETDWIKFMEWSDESIKKHSASLKAAWAKPGEKERRNAINTAAQNRPDVKAKARIKATKRAKRHCVVCVRDIDPGSFVRWGHGPQCCAQNNSALAAIARHAKRKAWRAA